METHLIMQCTIILQWRTTLKIFSWSIASTDRFLLAILCVSALFETPGWVAEAVFRGAKVAMTVALKSPHLVKALISVDNAPIDVKLKSNFQQYVQGLREVEEKIVKNQAEADEILKRYEKVSN